MSGYIDASIYVILTAFGFVFIDVLYAEVPPLVALFVMLLVAVFCFNVINLPNLVKIYKTCLDNLGLFILMSGLLMIDWFCSMYGVHYADPFVYLASLFIAVALVGYLQLLFSQSSKSKFVLILSLCILVAALFLMIILYQGRPTLLLGIALAMICGFSFYGYGLTSIKLLQAGDLSSSEVLATRFWLVLIVVAIIMPKHNLLYTIQHNILKLGIISLITMIIPIFYYQQALKKIGAVRTSITISCTPIVAYAVFAIYNQVFILNNFIISIVIVLAMLVEHLKVFSKDMPTF